MDATVTANENQEGMEMNGDISFCLYMKRNITNRISEALIFTSIDDDHEENSEKMLCLCFTTRLQNKIIKR